MSSSSASNMMESWALAALTITEIGRPPRPPARCSLEPCLPGSKIHLVCEGHGLPLTAAVTAANVADVTMPAAMVDDIPSGRTASGRRRTRPAKVHADKTSTRVGVKPGWLLWLRERGGLLVGLAGLQAMVQAAEQAVA